MGWSSIEKMKKVVTIGGGSGHSRVLKAIKNIPEIIITGICPSTDSGGSTGILKKQYDGSGYTGDLTKCFLAFCEDKVVREALMYRYESGPLHAHSVKNLLFHALEKVSDTDRALAAMGKICGLGEHRVLPVTTEKTELHATLKIGNTISGETNIDTIAKNPLWNPAVHSIDSLYLKPSVTAARGAKDAVVEAEYIVICPGDLYSSILPVLLPEGMKEALMESKAKIIILVNIMTKQGETDNFTASDFVAKIETELGKPADHILYNIAPISEETLLRYSLESKVEMTADTEGDSRLIGCSMAEIAPDGSLVSSLEVIETELTKLIQS